MSLIRFGTDGWRAIIAEDYTIENLNRVTYATGLWLNKKEKSPSVIIGYDCRFGGKMFSESVAKLFCAMGIKVYLTESFASTPMVSLGVVNKKASLGIVITASHNPPEYNGFKLKGSYGGPSLPADISEVESMIPEKIAKMEIGSMDDYLSIGKLEYIDLETNYYDHALNTFDIEKMNQSGILTTYDAMYGAGQNIVKRLFEYNATFLNCDFNPSFKGQAPEPLHKNLLELSSLIKRSEDAASWGFATDGDADRLGVYDGQGNFIDSHHVILLLTHYLHKYKKMSGKVVISFSCSNKIKKLCEHYNLDCEITKIGFKYICEHMIKEDVLVGGEESGGIAVKGHIPERDGVWNALLLLEFMTSTRKNMQELIQEVYDIVGSFAFERNDLHISESIKQKVIENCKKGKYKSFGEYKIVNTESLDGYKFYLDENSWVMIRPSGTEPVLRVYAEAENQGKVLKILEEAKKELMS